MIDLCLISRLACFWLWFWIMMFSWILRVLILNLRIFGIDLLLTRLLLATVLLLNLLLYFLFQFLFFIVGFCVLLFSPLTSLVIFVFFNRLLHLVLLLWMVTRLLPSFLFGLHVIWFPVYRLVTLFLLVLRVFLLLFFFMLILFLLLLFLFFTSLFLLDVFFRSRFCLMFSLSLLVILLHRQSTVVMKGLFVLFRHTLL